MAPYRKLLTKTGRMATMAPGSPADLAYVLASRVHGSRRVRFVQSPATGPLLASLARYLDDEFVIPVIELFTPWTTSPPPTARWKRAAASASASSRSPEPAAGRQPPGRPAQPPGCEE